MEFKTISTQVATIKAVSHNVLARVRERSTGNINVICVENFEGNISDFKKKFTLENKNEYALAWAIFAPVDENDYDEAIAIAEEKFQAINEKSKVAHRAKREAEKEA